MKISERILRIKNWTKDTMKSDVEKAKKEVKSKSWIYVIVACMIGYLGHCTVQYIITIRDVGSFSNEKFEAYLIDEISREYGYKIKDNIEISKIDKHQVDMLSDEETLFVYGSYEQEGNETQDRFITIFEKADVSFFNILFGTTQKYEIKSLYSIESDDDLYFTGHNYFDFNEDSIDEFYVELKTIRADSSYVSTIFFTKIAGQWKLVTLDLNSIIENVHNYNTDYQVQIEERIIKDKKDNTDYSFFLSDELGSLNFYYNKLFDHWDFCYAIRVTDLNKGFINNSNIIFVIATYKLSGAMLETDMSWNGGKIKILEGNEDFNFENNYGNYIEDGIIYYQSP